MHFIKFLLCSIPIGITLVIAGAIANGAAIAIVPHMTTLEQETQAPADVQLTQRNPPPPRRNPGGSAAGGRRDPSACPQDGAASPTSSTATSPAATAPLLTALSPTTPPGSTLAERPTFLVYVPRTNAETAEFSLRDQENRGVYRTTITLTQTPDIISISLPEQAVLEVDRPYTWSFAVICNPDDRVEDRFVTGSVQRIELEPTRLQQIEQASPQQRLAVYQENGIWYDALALLFELKRSQPNDPDLSAIWREFLQSAGADTIIDINLD
jgi:hypothetical protein